MGIEGLRHEILSRIACGTLVAGDELSAAELARARVVSPVRVRGVLQGLIELGVLLDFGEDRFLLTAECEAIARSALISDWSSGLKAEVQRLINSGCPKREIMARLIELGRSLETPEP